MKVTFDDCTIDTDRFQVERSGCVVSLTPQTAKILEILIKNSERVVTKDELAAAVWDGRIITDATISTALKETRQIVGDTGRTQSVIRTVHGRGFQFVANIKARSVFGTESDLTVVAIFPFRNLGPEINDQFIADGLTEDTIANLSRFPKFFVLSHRTTRSLAAEDISIAEMHARHSIDVVIEGSLRTSPERLRVTAQLTDASTGQLLATEQFERNRDVAGLFEIQEEVSRLIAGRAASNYGVLAEHIARRKERSGSLGTYVLVSQFHEYYRTYDPALHARLRDALPDMLAKEPLSADGWAAYSLLLLEEYRYHINTRPGVDALGLADDAAKRAVNCDNRSAFAQMALALAVFYKKDIASFRRIAARALELNSGHSDVLAEIGSCHLFLGEYDRAVELLDQAIALSPVHPGWYHYARCWWHAERHEFEAALLEINKVPMPEFFWFHAHLAWLHAELDQIPQAQSAAKVLLEMFPNFEDVAYEELERTNIDRNRGARVVAGWRKTGLNIKG